MVKYNSIFGYLNKNELRIKGVRLELSLYMISLLIFYIGIHAI